MKPENEQFLKDNLHQFITIERAFYVRGLTGHVRENMMRIMAEEFAPGYSADLWCPSCVMEMVKLLYRSYYNYLKAKLNDTNVYKDLSEGIEQMMNREPEEITGTEEVMIGEPAEGIQIPDPSNPLPRIKANFPYHKKRK